MTEQEFDNYEQENDACGINDYYINRRLQKNQMERKVRRSKMWLARFRVLVRLFVIILLILLGKKLINSSNWYLNKDIFKTFHNTALEIDNNKIVPSYKVLNALRRTEIPHVPVYRLETDEIKENILQLEPVENVYIRRFWLPARLQIIIEECTPILTISPALNAPPVAFFTDEGKLIGRDYMPLDKSFKTNLVFAGNDYKKWDKERVKMLDNVAKAVKENSNEEVEYIDVRNPKDVYVKIKTVNLRLGDLDDAVFERIQRIPSILPQVKMLDKKIKYIDLRWKNTNYIKLG